MSFAAVSKEYNTAIRNAKRKLRVLIAENQCAPIFLQLAWQSAGFFDGISPKIDVPFEAPDSDDMKNAFRLLKPIKEKFPIISYADLCQLAGVVAVEITGGPEIPFRPGRKDLGLTDQEFVALAGVCAKVQQSQQIEEDDLEESPYFDRSYYKMLLDHGVGGSNQIDATLKVDPYRQWVEKYTSDNEAFVTNFEAAHLKLSEMKLQDA